MEARNLADLYQLPLLDWAAVEARLSEGLSPQDRCWLATIKPDGTPHLTGVGPLWVDGHFWFKSGKAAHKARNLARDPRCTLSVSTQEFDLAVEGEATLVTDASTVADLAARWAAGGWPARVDASGLALTAEYSAPSAGPPPWDVYRLTPRAATAVGTAAPGGATRWRF